MISRCWKYLVDKNKSIGRINKNASIGDVENIEHLMFNRNYTEQGRVKPCISKRPDIHIQGMGASCEVKGDPPDSGSGVLQLKTLHKLVDDVDEIYKKLEERTSQELQRSNAGDIVEPLDPFVETKETGHHNTNVGNCNSDEFINHCGYTGSNYCNSSSRVLIGTSAYYHQPKIVMKPKESNAKLQQIIQKMQTKKENEVTTNMSINHPRREPTKSLTCTREFGFDAAHRLVGHEDKCSNVHGHRYRLIVTMESTNGLDSVGRILDFSKIKEVIGEFIDDNLDHVYIANSVDVLIDALGKYDMRTYLMDGNPTAENMVKMLYRELTDILISHNVHIVNIKLYETPNCYAEYGYSYHMVDEEILQREHRDEY